MICFCRQAVVCGDSERTGGDVTRRSTGIPVSTVQKTSAVREREEVRQSNEGKATSGQGHQGTKSEPRPVPGMMVTTNIFAQWKTSFPVTVLPVTLYVGHYAKTLLICLLGNWCTPHWEG